MTLHRLEVYLTVAKHLHISRAAQELHVSQSAISREVKLLQDDYGAVFIKRKSKGIELTPAGVDFQRDAKIILEMLVLMKMKYRSGT
jgi:DNA-binding transcriptional LysR family regulator